MPHTKFHIAAAFACIVLTGCTSDRLGLCPSVSVLVDTAAMPVFAADGKSIPYSVQMTNAKRDCDMDKFSKNVGASVDIDFRALRMQAGAPASYTVPYFVAVTSEGHVLAKQLFSVQFSFPADQRVVDFSDSVNSIQLSVGRDKKPADYGILVGFQISKAQLDYNRRKGRYAQ